MTPRHRIATVAVALCAATAACGPRDAEPDAILVSTHTDSAGVDIVFSEVPAAGAPAFALLDSVPSMRLGSVDGADEEQFGSIRDLAPMGDGGVAVLDQQAAQVRLFGPGGAYLGALGAKGEGPGELMNPGSLERLPGDTFAVYDWRTRRITRYGAAGGDPDVRTLKGGGTTLPNTAFFFPDGRLVGSIRLLSGDGASLPNEGEDRLALDSAVIVVYSALGDFVDSAAVIPNRESIQKWMRAGQGINVLISTTAFARSGVYAAHADGVWAGFGDRWELRLYDAVDGTLRRIVRAPGLERSLTESEIQAVYDAAAGGDTNPGQRERRAVWWVFKPEGDLLGSVDAPAGVTLLAVFGSDAWGVLKDELDVQYVVKYPMTGAIQ